MAYEYLPYKSFDPLEPASPGLLVRDDIGDYFFYESVPEGTRVGWSTEQGIVDCLDAFYLSFTGAQPSKALNMVSVYTGDESYEVKDVSYNKAMLLLMSDKLRIASAKLAFAGIDLFWQEAHAQFEDRDTERMEVGLWSPHLDIPVSTRFAARTGVQSFFADAQAKVQIPIGDSYKEFSFKPA